MYKLIRSEPRISNDRLKPANWIVALENGLLDLNSRDLLSFSPNVFVTSLAKGSFTFGAQIDCPQFSHYLEVVTGSDETLKQRIWGMLGYCLVPDVSGKVFFLLQGVPDSGKSLLGEFLASCFDEDMVTSLDFAALGQQFGPSELVGKQLCLSMDLAAVPWDAEAIGPLKSLTGNDLVSADIKYQPRIRFRNTATFLFGTKYAVTTTVRDDTFFRRMVVIPFQVSVPKSRQDRHLLQRFQAEKDAIITKAINDYLFLRENNYVFNGNYDVNAVVS